MNEKKREILETKQLETFTKFLKRVMNKNDWRECCHCTYSFPMVAFEGCI